MPKTAEESVIDRSELERAIEQIRPSLQSHGGDIELIGVVGDEVTVRLTGACRGCPMAAITMKQGVERFLLQHVRGLKTVVAA